ncbi:hypothetical protein ABZW38_16720 [Streptomyces bacillaris]|uniref:hypothetical protein n=1 Tax=Streptomyces bacillaris TaxID=68179 RepID=UPI00345F4923
MSPTEQIDGTAVVTRYFEDRIAIAEKGVKEARAALARAEEKVEQREAERDAFVQDGSLHPPTYNADTGQPEWELCQWAQTRIAYVAFDRNLANDAAYERLRAEEKALHQWLREHGRIVPAPFGEKA